MKKYSPEHVSYRYRGRQEETTKRMEWLLPGGQGLGVGRDRARRCYLGLQLCMYYIEKKKKLIKKFLQSTSGLEVLENFQLSACGCLFLRLSILFCFVLI